MNLKCRNLVGPIADALLSRFSGSGPFSAAHSGPRRPLRSLTDRPTSCGSWDAAEASPCPCSPLPHNSKSNSAIRNHQQNVPMKSPPLLLLFLLALSVTVGCSDVRAASITVASPAAGSALNCTVGASVSITFAGGERQSDAAVLQITDNVGNLSSVYLPNNGGTAGSWDTTSVPNGSVTLSARVPYSANGQSLIAYAPNITVTVKNGFVVSDDAAKTYAKVTLPTAGQSIIANGQSFVITSDHKLTCTRFDNCQSAYVPYEFKRTTTYSSPKATEDVKGYLVVGNQAKDWDVSMSLGGGDSYIAGGATPVTYYIYVFTYANGAQVAQGSSTFTMSPIPGH